MSSIQRFLERKLKLVVNEAKSAVDVVWMRKFLGYRLGRGGKLYAAPESLQRFKDKMRNLTRRNQGMGTPLALCQFDVDFCKTIKTEFHSFCKGKCQIKSKLSHINYDVIASNSVNAQSALPAFFKAWVYPNGTHGCWPCRAKVGGDYR